MVCVTLWVMHDSINLRSLYKITYTAKKNLIRHDIRTYLDSYKYVMTYHRMSDGLPSLQVTMWIERLSLLVIHR